MGPRGCGLPCTDWYNRWLDGDTRSTLCLIPGCHSAQSQDDIHVQRADAATLRLWLKRWKCNRKGRNMKRSAAVVFLLGLAALAAFFAPKSAARAGSCSQYGGWSERIIVYEDPDDSVSIRAQLAADPFGGIHLMWYREQDGAIMYSRWDGLQWTVPSDVLISPRDDSTYWAAFAIDRLGRLHAVWGGGRALYYSHSWYDQAQNAANWSAPIAIGPPAASYSIVAEGADHIHLLYSALGEEVYYLSSQDGGATWAKRIQVSESPIDTATNEPRLFLDERGTLHAVWNGALLPSGYPPSGIFYAQSTDRGAGWSPPVQLAGLDMGQPNVAVAGDRTIHVVWNGRAGIGGRFHIWSSDGGNTWSRVENIEFASEKLRGGLTHPPSLTVDGKGNLHILYTSNTPGAVYTYWTGKGLATPTLLVSSDEAGWWTERALLFSAFGNQLHLVVMVDSGKSTPTPFLWHTWKLLSDAPPIPPAPLPGGKPAPTPVSTTPTAQAQQETSPVQPSLLPETLTSLPPAGQDSAPGFLLVAGMIPAVILLAAVVGYHALHRRGR